jgi:hypothetical protein
MKHLSQALALLLLALVVSCSENPTQAERLKGSLTLNVVLMNEYAERLEDRGNVTIEIDGTGRTATTDAEGYATFQDLPAGTYVLTLKKPGFSTVKSFGYQFVGGGAAYIRDVFMVELPTFTITELTADAEAGTSSGEDVVKLTGKISSPAPEGFRQMLRLYLDMSSLVSSEPGMYIDGGSIAVLSPETDFTAFYSLRGLRAAGIAKGTRVYVVAHPLAQWTTGYFEPTTRGWYETNISPEKSPVASFIMP